MERKSGWSGSLVAFVALLAAVALGGVPTAEAFKTFDYSQQGGFTIGTETSGAQDNAAPDFPPSASGIRFFGPQPDNSVPLPAGTLPGGGTPAADQWSTMGWGGSTAATSITGNDPIDDALTSALKLETVAGQITSDGTFETIAVLTHRNITIQPRWLRKADIDTLLRFTDPAAGNAAVNIAPGDVAHVPITFHETDNFVACDPDIQLGPLPCTDYFVFPLGSFAPTTFTYLGVNYTLQFRLVPQGTAEVEQVNCNELIFTQNPGAPDPTGLCGRIRTAEGDTKQVLVQMALTEEAQPPADTCPRTQGFWKNHPDDWPPAVAGVGFTVGGVLYSEAELIAIFKTPPKKGNATLILAHQLIAARLNVFNGTDPTPIDAALTAADALLAGLNPKLSFVHASSALGQQMVALANTLDQFNNGANSPGCIGPK